MFRNFATASRPRMLVSPAWEIPSALSSTRTPDGYPADVSLRGSPPAGGNGEKDGAGGEGLLPASPASSPVTYAAVAADRNPAVGPAAAPRRLLSAYVAQLGAEGPPPTGSGLGAGPRPVERLVERSAWVSEMTITDLERERRAVARAIRNSADPLALFEARLRLAALTIRDRDSAMAHLGVALQMAETVFRDPFFAAGVLDRMAAVEAMAGQGAKAVALEERARVSLRPLLETHAIDRDAIGLGIVILFNLGLCYLHLGYKQKGLAMMGDALSAAHANNADEAILEIMETAVAAARKVIAAEAAPPQRKRY